MPATHSGGVPWFVYSTKCSPADFAACASEASTTWLNVSVLARGMLKIVFPRAFAASNAGPGGVNVGTLRYLASLALIAEIAPGLQEPLPDDATVVLDAPLLLLELLLLEP